MDEKTWNPLIFFRGSRRAETNFLRDVFIFVKKNPKADTFRQCRRSGRRWWWCPSHVNATRCNEGFWVFSVRWALGEGWALAGGPTLYTLIPYTSILPSLNCKVPKRIKKKRRDTWSFGHYIFPIFPDGSFTQRLPWCIGCIWPKAEPFESLRNSSFKLAKLWLQKSEKKTI